jgi:hypothetical protein
MKKIIFTGLLIVLFNLWGYSQQENSVKDTKQNSQDSPTQAQDVKKSDYSAQNLQQASIEDLNLYLKKAKGLKTTGLAATIAGPVMTVGGVILLGVSWGNYGYLPTFAGLAVTAIGVPILITGSSRVYKVKYAMDAHNGISLSVAPGLVFANQNTNPYPGISLKLRF